MCSRKSFRDHRSNGVDSLRRLFGRHVLGRGVKRVCQLRGRAISSSVCAIGVHKLRFGVQSSERGLVELCQLLRGAIPVRHGPSGLHKLLHWPISIKPWAICLFGLSLGQILPVYRSISGYFVPRRILLRHHRAFSGDGDLRIWHLCGSQLFGLRLLSRGLLLLVEWSGGRNRAMLGRNLF